MMQTVNLVLSTRKVPNVRIYPRVIYKSCALLTADPDYMYLVIIL